MCPALIGPRPRGHVQGHYHRQVHQHLGPRLRPGPGPRESTPSTSVLSRRRLLRRLGFLELLPRVPREASRWS
ncbi:probable carboxylesterase 6 [Phtheirospermum japonicum]|uniref:Probable carboxylesterase 6 n=1 Tax=Phtheirospermum japonicum TaxID=374723 RepID=A0A830CE56_9LAMI|nr:probable carboxylesterase 6 [Phtheirospermum japonicum]